MNGATYSCRRPRELHVHTGRICAGSCCMRFVERVRLGNYCVRCTEERRLKKYRKKHIRCVGGEECTRKIFRKRQCDAHYRNWLRLPVTLRPSPEELARRHCIFEDAPTITPHSLGAQAARPPRARRPVVQVAPLAPPPTPLPKSDLFGIIPPLSSPMPDSPSCTALSEAEEEDSALFTEDEEDMDSTTSEFLNPRMFDISCAWSKKRGSSNSDSFSSADGQSPYKRPRMQVCNPPPVVIE